MNRATSGVAIRNSDSYEKLAVPNVWQRYKKYGAVVIWASILLNLIVFSGSVYMMLVYDSVIPSHSVPTLLGLFLMLIVLYGFQAVFEFVRGEAMLGIANGIHAEVYSDLHYATSAAARNGIARNSDGLQLIRDFDQLHGFLIGPAPLAIMDLPWVVLFLLVLTSLHWALGVTALGGTLAMIALAIYSNRQTARGSANLHAVLGARSAATLQEIRFSDAAAALGMQPALLERSAAFEKDYISSQSVLSRVLLRLGSASKISRMLLQSLLLTVGALLVISGKASGGVILASSVLSGRALAPIDTLIGNWRVVTTAKAGWGRLCEALTAFQPPAPRTTKLPRPAGEVELRDVWLTPPGNPTPVVSGVTLTLKPGQAIAVIGASAAGKSSLAKALAGIWMPARGELRVGGATYDQWDHAVFGKAIGYVPQTVDLLDGTVSENIARFEPGATAADIIRAATEAGIHETILSLPNGYDTFLSSNGGELSIGQRQRLSLARALYGDPFMLILDEANSNLDAAGDAALAATIETVKARSGIVIMITHRPSTLAPATHVAVMDSGRVVEFGQRDEVLSKLGLAKPITTHLPGSQKRVAAA